jgi:acetamidase/formamidase
VMVEVVHEIDHEAPPAELVYSFGGVPAVRAITPGTIVSTSTRDCFAGQLRTVRDLSSQACDPRYLNPQTGPFFVEGAEPGDTLAVHFVSIEPRESWGVSCTVPFFGALTATPTTALLHGALPELTWIYDLDRTTRTVRYQARQAELSLPLPMDPMHGTVGVAPPLGEVRSSLAPGSWGGNMDTPEMRAGVTCYLGVNVEGALLSLGDGHARQGEGESCGVAVECAMDTVFAVELLKGVPTPWPRLESDTDLMTTGSARPLEDAFRISQVEMVGWVGELLGLASMDAYQLVAQIARSPVANVCDTVYTMVCKVPKDVLGNPAPMDGVHARLRSAAAGR